MIVGECKIGNTIIRCDDSCVVKDPERLKKIRENLSAIAARQYARKIEKEAAKDETA